MPKHTLFVCKYCHNSSEKLSEQQPTDGSLLIENLNVTFDKEFPSEQVEIQPTHCIRACDRACVVAICSPEKPTYLFVDLPIDKTSTPLLEFMQLYIESRTGAIAWKNFPQLLQSAIFAQIPSQNHS